MMTTLILWFVFMVCIAPCGPQPLIIIKTEPLYFCNIRDPFLRAVIWYESNFFPKIVNPVSKARGILQFLPPMIQEVNRICKIYIPSGKWRYTWDDAFDPIKSIEMWYIVQIFKNSEYNLSKACTIWFGTGTQYDGKTAIIYINDIKTFML
jgi:hypothetical protein